MILPHPNPLPLGEGVGSWRHSPDLVLFGRGEAEDVGGAAGVAGVDDTAHGAVAGHKGIGFVNEEGGHTGVNGAKKGADGDIRGDEGFGGHGGENAQEGGFAAAFFGGFNGHVGDGIAHFKGVGVQDPNGKRGGRVVAENDMLFNDDFDVGEEVADLDGVGAGDDGIENDSFGFHGFLEHSQKYCSPVDKKKNEAVFLDFGFVSAQSQAAAGMLPRQSLAKTHACGPKTLAPHG
jgi:hypothetical protein